MKSVAGAGVRVSVVVPLYNAAPWVEETLESVYGQGFSSDSLEIIVVDDGSSDGGDALAERSLRNNSRPFQVIHQTNSGASKARNTGWQQARGEWIQFLDADDLLGAGKVQGQLAASGGADVVFSDWQPLRRVDGEWCPASEPRTPQVADDPLTDLIGGNGFIPTGSAIMRRALLEQIGGFDERMTVIEDTNLLLRSSMAGARFTYVPLPSPVLFYRQVEGSLHRRDEQAFWDGVYHNAVLVEDHCRSEGTLTPRRAERLAATFATCADAFRGLDAVRCEQALRRGIHLHPREDLHRLERLVRMVGVTPLVAYTRAWRRTRQTLGKVKRAITA